MGPVTLTKSDVAVMLAMSTYSLPTNETTLRALAVVNELQDWLDLHCTGETTPQAGLLVGQYFLQVSIGDTGLWDSENNSEEELTVENITESWRQELVNLMTAFNPPGL